MAAILIPIFILIAIVLLSSHGGIVKDFDFQNLFNIYPTALIEKQAKSPQLPSQTPQTQIKQAPLSTPSPVSKQLPVPKISPYFGKINISRITSPANSLSSSFTLTPKLAEGEKINITDWYFETTIGRYTIPQGIKILKENEETAPKENIVLEPGQKLIISTNPDPDENLLENDWYIFIEGGEFLREVYDRVTLYDQNNFFVDQKIY
ncbi:hypothetical protein IIA94_00600 [Patescibacteria group bacterium]|nr:hypothetical protein [Patescibacteria group bacterium]